MKERKLSGVSVVVLLACLASAPAVIATTYNLYPTDDVCVQSDYPDTQGNPTGSLLYVGGPFVENYDYWATYIKFDLSQFAAGTINSATLYMLCYDHSGSSVSVNAYEVTNDPPDWSEYAMTWNCGNNILTVSGTPAHITQINAANAWFTWDLTYEAQQHKGGDFSICMKEQNQPSQGKWARLYSKDAQVTGSWPYLAVSYTAPEANDRWYDWEDLATIIGYYGNCQLNIAACNVTIPEPVCSGFRSLSLENCCPTGIPQAYLAYVYGLADGDEVYCSFWRYDTTPTSGPSCGIWAHWNDSNPPDVNGDNGSAGGNPDLGPGEGWDMTDWSWVVSGGHAGLVIECRLYSDPGGIVWIDNMHVRAPAHATIVVPTCDPSAIEPTTWGTIKALFK